MVIDDEEAASSSWTDGPAQSFHDTDLLAQLRGRGRWPRDFRRGCEVDRVLDDTIECQCRILVEGNCVDFVRTPHRTETVVESSGREAWIVLASAEALFLRGRDNLASPNRRSGGIVVKRRHAYDRLHSAAGLIAVLRSTEICTTVPLPILADTVR